MPDDPSTMPDKPTAEGTLSSSLALWILGLTRYTEHKDADEKFSIVQNPQTRWALFLMTTVVPVVGYLLMLLPIRFYNITGESHRQMMKEIMRRREAAGSAPVDLSEGDPAE